MVRAKLRSKFISFIFFFCARLKHAEIQSPKQTFGPRIMNVSIIWGLKIKGILIGCKLLCAVVFDESSYDTFMCE